MIMRISLLYRKNGMSREAFQSHWRDVHAPLASRMPGLRSYLQLDVTRTLGLLGRGSAVTPPDGIAELAFDSAEASQAALASEAGRVAVADLANFCGAISTFVVEERRIV
jgi:uncharacterized protein (TIGR02118 family)